MIFKTSYCGSSNTNQWRNNVVMGKKIFISELWLVDYLPQRAGKKNLRKAEMTTLLCLTQQISKTSAAY